MPVFDQIIAVGTRRFPAAIVHLLAQGEIPIPEEGKTIPIAVIDKVLQGRSVEARVNAKSLLRACGLIEK